MSSRRLQPLETWFARHCGDRPFGCLVVEHGKVAGEWYGGGFGPDSLFEIGSIRKSFNSALIGIGIARGDVDLHQKACAVWPELVEISGDQRDEAVTLHQLASGTSGWLTADPPGAVFRYNNAAFTAAERVVARLYHLPDDETAGEVARRFKGPLGADSWQIYHFDRRFDANDIDDPGPKLAVDSNVADLVKWGELWLQRGVWNSQRLIPPAHVDCATRLANPGLKDAWYGYSWFVNADRVLWPAAPEGSYGHPGFGSFKPSEEVSRAYLWICPAFRVVAAMVTDVTVGIASDYLDIPNGVTAAWIAAIARSLDWRPAAG